MMKTAVVEKMDSLVLEINFSRKPKINQLFGLTSHCLHHHLQNIPTLSKNIVPLPNDQKKS
jgi:hypothetical protein